MAKNSHARTLSAALQHRKSSGDFDKARAEKQQADLRHRRHPVRLTRRRSSAVQDARASVTSEAPSSGVLLTSVIVVALSASLVLVSVAIASAASATCT